jgi:ribulose-phosphate 3-epimerase
MMCADFSSLGREVSELEAAGVDGFHLDVMDGSYVPNFALGLGDVACICSSSHLPCDVHLMVNEPANCIETFINAGARIVYIHPEADKHPARTLQRIRDCGAAPGIALDTSMSFETASELLPLCDYVLAMTVNPGFAGQAFCDYTLGKVRRLADAKSSYGYQLVIDGACSPERIALLSREGVDGFVLGTSALFGKGDYSQILSGIRAA